MIYYFNRYFDVAFLLSGAEPKSLIQISLDWLKIEIDQQDDTQRKLDELKCCRKSKTKINKKKN